MVWGPYNVLYFPVYEYLKHRYAHFKLQNSILDSSDVSGGTLEEVKRTFSPFETAACAMAGSAVSTIATSPMDVIKTRLQALEKQAGGGSYKQVWDGLKADGVINVRVLQV